VDNALGGCR